MSNVSPTTPAASPLPSVAADFSSPDLNVRPPRSPHVRLGGYVILPRILDKGRASLAGKSGAYIYNSGLDKRFFSFVKISADSLLEEIATGKGDGELLAWVTANSEHKPSDWEIAYWSGFQGERTATSLKARDYYAKELAKLAPARIDVATGFDFLDLDDHVAFGGKA